MKQPNYIKHSLSTHSYKLLAEEFTRPYRGGLVFQHNHGTQNTLALGLLKAKKMKDYVLFSYSASPTADVYVMHKQGNGRIARVYIKDTKYVVESKYIDRTRADKHTHSYCTTSYNELRQTASLITTLPTASDGEIACAFASHLSTKPTMQKGREGSFSFQCYYSEARNFIQETFPTIERLISNAEEGTPVSGGDIEQLKQAFAKTGYYEAKNKHVRDTERQRGLADRTAVLMFKPPRLLRTNMVAICGLDTPGKLVYIDTTTQAEQIPQDLMQAFATLSVHDDVDCVGVADKWVEENTEPNIAALWISNDSAKQLLA